MHRLRTVENAPHARALARVCVTKGHRAADPGFLGNVALCLLLYCPSWDTMMLKNDDDARNCSVGVAAEMLPSVGVWRSQRLRLILLVGKIIVGTRSAASTSNCLTRDSWHLFAEAFSRTSYLGRNLVLA